MKKFLLFLLALCLLTGCALGETIVNIKVLNSESVELHPDAKTLIDRVSSRAYQIVDTDLNPLSNQYESIYVRSGDGGFYEVRKNDKYGLLDGQGKELIPPEYDDIQIIGAKFAAGIKLKSATSGEYDYESFGSNKKYYLIDSVDLYSISGAKITLTRDEWVRGSEYGNYVAIRLRNGKYTFYNLDLESLITTKDNSEYTTERKGNSIVITHQPSGQEAFTAGCTLSEDEVKQAVWIREENRQKLLVNLQGEELADLTAYYSLSVREPNVIQVYSEDGKYGLLDSEGKELVPCVYDTLDYNLETAVRNGYAYAVKDGKAGFKEFAEEFFEQLKDVLEGPNAIAISKEDATAAARILAKFAKTAPNLEIKAGVVEGTLYDANGMKSIASVPSREELLSKLLGSLQSPITNFARVLNQIAEQGGATEGAAEAKEEAPAAEEAPVEEAPAAEEAPAEEAAAEEAPAEEATEE